MPTVHVNLADRSYDVLVDHGLLHTVGTLISESSHSPRNIAIISDSNVAPLHAQTLTQSLESSGFPYSLHTIPAGESSKSMTVVESVCREMIQSGHDRKSLVIALGGGVVGDLAGFVASIFYRGIPFIQIPTTIVAQVDSSVGGKTGVNVTEGKNLLGAFHQPTLVVVDPETLKSLPAREYHEGFAEAIKHAAIRDAEMIHDLLQLDPTSRSIPADLIARNIAIKARIVEADEHETLEIRALLNFGHTIGHGIEAAVPYGSLLHGEAISLGIRAALFLSEQYANLPTSDSEKILKLLHQFHLPLTLDPSITTETILDKLSKDKKFSAGQIRFVLVPKLGEALVSKTISIENLKSAIEFLRTPPALIL